MYLIDKEIKEEATVHKLIDPFEEANLKGGSYDIRAGKTAILYEPAPPKAKGYLPIDLEFRKAIIIAPGHSCTFYSLEVIKIPADIQGFIFNREHWITKRINFDGGIIDPGYEGHLFITFTNLGDNDIEINYKDKLVSLAFVRFHEPASVLFQMKRYNLETKKLADLPSGWRSDVIKLGGRIEDIEKKLETITPLVYTAGSFVESVILGSLAGIIAGVLIIFLPKIPQPWKWVICVGAILIMIVMFFRGFFFKSRFRK